MKSVLIPDKVRVLDYFEESNDIFTLTLDVKRNFMPGQFVQISMFGIGECPISVASYHNHHLKLTIRKVGKVTKALSKLRKDDYVYIRGPYGNGYPLERYEGKSLILIGAGCGVATLKGIVDYVEHHRNKYDEVLLFFGYRFANDIIYKKDVESWKDKFQIKIALSREPGKTCLDWNPGYITDVIKNLDLRCKDTAVFVCGPPAMINDTVKILKEKGFHDDQIYMAAERLMYCATGVCCHCMIRGKFTCTDGPVFRFDEIGYYATD